MQIISFIIDILRRIRREISTFVLKHLCIKYGESICASRIPRISRNAKVVIGQHVHFNGITITGWGGGESW